jgi:competence protein ComFA
MNKCERCGCEDLKYFVNLNGNMQCRRCIQYQGYEGSVLFYDEDVETEMSYQLTDRQKECSRKILDYSQNKDVLVNAVCGAGKTELVLETIQHALENKKKVGIAVARRQVVLQLYERLSKIFSSIKVVAVCEGFTDDCEGHLIISTTHQLFRFHKMFDILILDEPDAFPFSQDETLQGFAKQAVIGHTIYLTATPSDDLIKCVKKNEMVEVRLFRRPHDYDLVIPVCKYIPLYGQFVYLKHWLRKFEESCLIFVPSIKLGNQLSTYLGIPFVYAGCSNLDSQIKQFKENSGSRLICTTVLERGVTFENVQVAVLYANHSVFNLASLTQISGRVGRSMNYPSGRVLFLCTERKAQVTQCIEIQIQANA